MQASQTIVLLPKLVSESNWLALYPHDANANTLHTEMAAVSDGVSMLDMLHAQHPYEKACLHSGGLLGPAAPFKLDQNFVSTERLYNRQVAASEQESEDDNSLDHVLVHEDTKAVVEDAITQEWLRIRSQRLAFAS